ncbi:MAG: LicD family protein [Solobacterium sp.]|nr:LicD family protein [Solobacterium sp.]
MPSDVMTLREVQMAELEILLKFDRFCRENNLRYVLYYGTLLGAARHQGFIPWDDDIDIAMSRPEYDRFLKLVYDEHKVIDPDYYVLSGDRDDGFAMPFAKVFDRNIEIVEESKLYRHDSDHLWIDIFPIDGFPDDWETNGYLKKIGNFRRNIGRSVTIPGTRRGKESIWKTLVRIPVAAVYNLIGYRRFRDGMIRTALQYPYDQCEYVGLSCWNDNSAALVHRRSDFETKDTMMFEGHELPIFGNYISLLEKRYSKKWYELPPESVRQSHYIQARRIK